MKKYLSLIVSFSWIQKNNSYYSLWHWNESTTHEDIDYLDANRWEEFILKKLPQLEKFYFKYSAYFAEDYQTPVYIGQRDPFISSFWRQRQWILETEIEFENIIYSIRPYQYIKKKFLYWII